MGLIKAAVEAVGSTLHDQWKDYIKCDDLGQDVLMKKVTTSTGVISKIVQFRFHLDKLRLYLIVVKS